MLKIIIGVVIAIFLMKIMKVVFIAVCSSIRISKLYPKRKSEYREAFEMECSEQMIKEDEFARKLHKDILRIDREIEKLKRKTNSVNKRICNL